MAEYIMLGGRGHRKDYMTTEKAVLPDVDGLLGAKYWVLGREGRGAYAG